MLLQTQALTPTQAWPGGAAPRPEFASALAALSSEHGMWLVACAVNVDQYRTWREKRKLVAASPGVLWTTCPRRMTLS